MSLLELSSTWAPELSIHKKENKKREKFKTKIIRCVDQRFTLSSLSIPIYIRWQIQINLSPLTFTTRPQIKDSNEHSLNRTKCSRNIIWSDGLIKCYILSSNYPMTGYIRESIIYIFFNIFGSWSSRHSFFSFGCNYQKEKILIIISDGYNSIKSLVQSLAELRWTEKGQKNVISHDISNWTGYTRWEMLFHLDSSSKSSIETKLNN